MNPIEIRPLKNTDDRSGFSCGNSDLDTFFRTYAGQNQFRHHIGTTYVAVEHCAVTGFATVSASHIFIDDLPDDHQRGFPQYPLPVLRLSRLGVAIPSQKKGIGRMLLKHVFSLAQEMAERFGCIGVITDAKPESAEFYRKYGFIELEVIQGKLKTQNTAIALFLPLKVIPKR